MVCRSSLNGFAALEQARKVELKTRPNAQFQISGSRQLWRIVIGRENPLNWTLGVERWALGVGFCL
jgi:hypothetical protein